MINLRTYLISPKTADASFTIQKLVSGHTSFTGKKQVSNFMSIKEAWHFIKHELKHTLILYTINNA